MAIQNFIFGGDAIAKTPEELAKQRAVIQALQANSRAPRNVGEGLNALGDGIVANVLNRRANRAQTEGRESAAGVMEGIFGGMGGGSSPVTTPTTSRPTMSDAATSRVGQAHSGVLPSSFYDATNRTEGAGDYDTLFGHSQKDGPFAGTRVSQMTIGDALAFADPSGAYGQHVKGKVGRVATPMGAHQIVGTTLRNAAQEMGLDPSTPFNSETQDMIAGHLARKRLQGADTMQGKISALRSEWEGFKNIPDAQMMQIINDLETMPAGGSAVAANEAMATGQMAGGPKIIDPGIIGGAADGPPDPNIAPEWATNPNMAGQQPAGVQPAQLPPITATATEPMALQQPAPQQTVPMPQVPAQAAPQAPAGFPMEEMAGMDPQFLGGPSAPRPSVAQALSGPQGAPQQGQQGGQPSIQQLMQASANPWLSDSERQIVNALLQREMDNADPMRKLEMERAQLEIEQMRNPQPQDLMNAGDGRLYDPNKNEWITAPDAEVDAPKVQTLKLDDGSEMAVQWNGKTQTWDPINAPAGGGNITPRNKLTESQSKLTLFQNLQTETQPVLLDLESQFNPANLKDAAARSTPIAGNFFQSEQGQIYQASATAWAEGALRIATGAAATPEEMERTRKAYFAQPGDTPITIAFKAQMREMYNRSINKALGSTEEVQGLPKPSDFIKQFQNPGAVSGKDGTSSDPELDDLLEMYGD